MIDSERSQRRGSTQSDTSALVSSLTRDPSQSPSAVSTTANTRDLSPSPSCSSLHMRSEGSIASPPDTPKQEVVGVSDRKCSLSIRNLNAKGIEVKVNSSRSFFVEGFARKPEESFAGANANESGQRDHGDERTLQHWLDRAERRGQVGQKGSR